MKKIILFILVVAALIFGTSYVLKMYNATSEPEPSEPTLNAKETVRVTLRDIDAADPSSFEKIQDIIDLGHEAVEPLVPMIQSSNPIEKWTAVVGLAAVRDELDDQSAIDSLMEESYSSDFATIGLLAANSNATHGNYSGIPLALEQLSNDEIALYMDPPTPNSELAAAILRHVSGENYDFSAHVSQSEKDQAIAKWNAWWEVFRGVEGL